MQISAKTNDINHICFIVLRECMDKKPEKGTEDNT
jgi:hypothetical protein